MIAGHEDQALVLENDKKKRWIALLVLGLTAAVRAFSVSCFSAVNDISSIYFGVTEPMGDLLSTSSFLVKGFTNVLIAIFSKRLPLRTLCRWSCYALFAGNLFIALGIYSSFGYPITLLGQCIIGVAASLINTAPAVLSSAHFTNDRRAFALSVPWAIARITYAFSGIISTYTFPVAPTGIQNSTLGTNNEKSTFSDETLSGFRQTFLIIFFILTGLTFLALIGTIVYISRHGDPNLQHAMAKQWEITGEIKSILMLFTDINFVFITLANTMVITTKPMTKILFQGMILKAFPGVDDRTPARIFCVAFLVGAIGGPVAGVVVDRYRSFKALSIAGVMLLAVACAVVVLGYHYHNIPTTYLGFTLIVFFRDFAFVSITETLLEVKSHDDKLQLTSVYMAIPLLPVMACSHLTRSVIIDRNVVIASIIPIPFLVFGVLLLFGVNEKYPAPQMNNVLETVTNED